VIAPCMRITRRQIVSSLLGGSSLPAASCSGGGLCQSSGRRATTVVRASEERTPPKNTEFGYSRKDIILLGVGLIGLGYAAYYGLQAAGVEAGYAGNVVQLMVFLGICVGYISTYIIRVANKDMTYAKQLDEYEEAVMARRLSELAPEELDRLMTEVEEETKERAERKQRYLEAQAKEGKQ